MKKWKEIKIKDSDQSLFIRNCVKPAEIHYNSKRGQYALHNGERVYFDGIMNLHNKVYYPEVPEHLQEFDGIESYGYFNGIIVKFDSTYESIKIYNFYIGDSKNGK